MNNVQTRQPLSGRLKAWRKGIGLTQPQAAIECGVNVSTYRHWEQGVHEPDGAALKHVERILNEVFTGEGLTQEEDEAFWHLIAERSGLKEQFRPENLWSGADGRGCSQWTYMDYRSRAFFVVFLLQREDYDQEELEYFAENIARSWAGEWRVSRPIFVTLKEVLLRTQRHTKPDEPKTNSSHSLF